MAKSSTRRATIYINGKEYIRIHPKKIVSSPRQKPPMNRRRTYRPQPAQIPADSLCGDPCDTRDPRRFPRDPRRHVSPAHPILNSSFLILNCTYTFSAKEKDSETGLSHFGSRYYSSDLSIWLSVDPMAAKYPSLSPYTYCADNPVKLVDPDGEDIWEINEEGRIINHDKSFTEKDIVYRVDNNGNRIEGEFVAFDYGTIEQQKSITYSPDGKTVDTYDMYQVRGDDNGTKLFEFIAQTVSGAGIEVSQIQCGEEGKNGLNFITCSHEKPHDEVRNGNTYTVSSEKSGWLVFSGRLQYGYTIRAWNHSHPSSTNASEADMSLKASANKILQDSGRACPQYNIYHVPSKKTIPY